VEQRRRDTRASSAVADDQQRRPVSQVWQAWKTSRVWKVRQI
jgi:hypothetical protein